MNSDLSGGREGDRAFADGGVRYSGAGLSGRRHGQWGLAEDIAARTGISSRYLSKLPYAIACSGLIRAKRSRVDRLESVERSAVTRGDADPAAM
jgi:hypothetical protein